MDWASTIHVLSFLPARNVIQLRRVSKKWLEWTSGAVLWKLIFDRKFGREPDYIQLATSKSNRRSWQDHYMRTEMTTRINIKFEAHPGLLLTPQTLHELDITQYKRVESYNSQFIDGIHETPIQAILDQLRRKLHISIRTRHDTLEPVEVNQWVFDCHLGFAGQQLPFNIPTGIPNVQGDRAYYFRGTLIYDDSECQLTFKLWHMPRHNDGMLPWAH